MADLALPRKPWIAAIIGLFFFACPTAIVRVVGAVIVTPFDSQSFGARSHVGFEIGVGQPAVANRNAALSISKVAGVIGIAAAVEHSAPDKIFRIFSSAMCARAGARYLCAQASAGLGAAISKIAAKGEKLSSAIADASPSSVANMLDCDKATKALACDINEG